MDEKRGTYRLYGEEQETIERMRVCGTKGKRETKKYLT